MMGMDRTPGAHSVNRLIMTGVFVDGAVKSQLVSDLDHRVTGISSEYRNTFHCFFKAVK